MHVIFTYGRLVICVCVACEVDKWKWAAASYRSALSRARDATPFPSAFSFSLITTAACCYHFHLLPLIYILIHAYTGVVTVMCT